MMKTYTKTESDIATFDDLEYVCDERDEETFEFNGVDYIIIRLNGYAGHNGWLLCDFGRYFRKGFTKKAYKALSGDYETFDEFVNAPILDGRSIKERMGEGTAVFFEPKGCRDE